MSEVKARVLSPHDLIAVLRRYHRRWLIPAATITALTAMYALVKPAVWEASMALVVRDEATGGLTRPGKFLVSDAMKTTQETILELAKSRKVLEAALIDAGRPETVSDSGVWPTEKDVESFQGAIKLTPPKGAEFGKTEVFYLKVQSKNRQRATALASAVCRQLQRQFEQLREQKALSVTTELEKTLSLAQADLDASTSALRTMETQVGSDLAELRMLNELPSGDGSLRKISTEIANEVRTQKAAVKSNEELLALLKEAQEDSGRLLASPGRLLESQPALKRLKEGLVDAQLLTAKLLGNMSVEHPQVQAAKAAEQEVSQHLHQEIGIAVRGVEADLKLAQDRVEMLENQGVGVRQRLERLASLRAEYSNLAATAKHRTEILKTAQQELADARASQAAARTASLINPVDQPNTGSRPMGPGRTVLCLAGMFGGLVTGIGVLFLTVSPSELFDRSGSVVRPSVVTSVIAHTANAETIETLFKPGLNSTPNQGVPTVLSFKKALQKLSGGLN
jgi:uncharacterized protein involved in exopolysaccharide biosynthesis